MQLLRQYCELYQTSAENTLDYVFGLNAAETYFENMYVGYFITAFSQTKMSKSGYGRIFFQRHFCRNVFLSC